MKKVRLLIITTLFSLIVGCAIAPKPIDMVPTFEKKFPVKFDKSLKVDMAFGGAKSDPIFEGSNIDNEPFTIALTMSLKNSNLFNKINPTENADYILKTVILSQDQP